MFTTNLSNSVLTLAAVAMVALAFNATSANADVVLSSEDGEGEPATHFLQTTANGPSTNIDY